MTVDEFWAQSGSPKVSFVKMDIEGSEPQVLRGAHNFITRCRPVFITEVNKHKLALMKEEADVIYKILYDYNYKFMIFNDVNRKFESNPFDVCIDFYEALFVPQDAS